LVFFPVRDEKRPFGKGLSDLLEIRFIGRRVRIYFSGGIPEKGRFDG
jgi:hypothetical protein